jgi:2-C-methyl-D-erythritol 4-phosphate cytidylyltransferase
MALKRFAIIVAGGTGSRMNAELPKQFLMLAGKPVLMHSIEKFKACGAEVIVVLHPDYMEQWKQLCNDFNFKTAHQITNGGATRSESVANGLQLATDANAVVAIHDAARPMVTTTLINTLFEQAAIHGNAIPVLKIAESLRKISANGNETANRDEFVMIQTPQCFLLDKLLAAYSQQQGQSFTDDASLFESCGYQIHLVEGERNNFKITVADDLAIAEALLKFNK